MGIPISPLLKINIRRIRTQFADITSKLKHRLNRQAFSLWRREAPLGKGRLARFLEQFFVAVTHHCMIHLSVSVHEKKSPNMSDESRARKFARVYYRNPPTRNQRSIQLRGVAPFVSTPRIGAGK